MLAIHRRGSDRNRKLRIGKIVSVLVFLVGFVALPLAKWKPQGYKAVKISSGHNSVYTKTLWTNCYGLTGLTLYGCVLEVFISTNAD